VHLVRDRVGIKPLYYAHLDGKLVWASELKAIEAYVKPLTVDYSAVYDYLTYGYVPTPKSLYREVRKLEPGTRLSFDCRSGRLERTRYWQLRVAADRDADPVATVRRLLEESISAQQVSDTPLGFFLSGGVDSSAVVGIAGADHSNPHTFSIGFEAPAHSELEYAERVAEHVDTRHRSAVLTEEDAVALVPSMRRWFDEPFFDTSALPTFLVSRLASETVKVALTGDGGDEVFGGYRWYSAFPRRESRSGLPMGLELTGRLKSRGGTVRRAARGIERYLLLSGLAYYTRLLGGMIANEKLAYRSRWQIPDDYDDYWYFRQYYDATLPVRIRLQVLDFHTYLPDDILTKVDRVSMANSLEVRVPLLDTRLIEAVFALPDAARGRDKWLLKEAVRPLLPATILAREKRGFSVPAAIWTRSVFDRSQSRQENLLAELYPELMP
jgi:asparagine synthase (glutamine-hydrolysing)